MATASAVALLAATPAFARAAEEPHDTEVDALVVTARHYVPDNNSTASKSDIPLIETPQSVSVITRDQLDVLHLVDMEEAIRYTAGIRGGIYGSDDRYDWITVRGFRPGQYQDGLRLPKGGYAWSKLDLSLAESVEVMRGPSSGLYGSIAPGGMINTISRKPQLETAGHVEGQIGSYESYQGAGDATGSITDDGVWRYRVTGLYRENGTQVDFGDDRRIAFAPALTFQPNDRLNITLLTKFQEDNYGTSIQFLPAEGTKLPNPNGVISTNRVTGEPGYNVFHRQEHHAGYSLDYEVADWIDFHQGLRFSNVNVYYRAITGAGLGPDKRTLYRSYYTVDENSSGFTVDNNISFDFNTGDFEHKLLVGLDYARFESDFTDWYAFLTAPTIDIFNPVYGKPLTNPPLYTSSLNTLDQTGIYLQDQIKWKDFILTAGLRHDWTDLSSRNQLTNAQTSNEETATSGRIGLNYVFDFGLSPYIAYSKSFEPVIGTAFGGAAFSPVTGEQVEVGLKFQPRNWNSFITFSAYEMTQQNVVVPDTVNVGYSEQTGEVRIRGVELEGVARIDERFSINGQITYLDSEVIKSTRPLEVGKWLRETPQFQASLIADYTFQDGPLAGLGFGFGVRHVGETYGDGANLWGVDSYTLYDAIVHYDKGPWRMSVNANNLFDDTYLSNCASLYSCYYGKQRTVYATLTWRWGDRD